MPFIEKEKMKKGNIFGGACCLVLDVLSVRCFIDFQVKMLSNKLEKGVWNLRESLRLDYWLGDCQHKDGYFTSEDQMRSARDWVRIEKSKAFVLILWYLQVKGMRRNQWRDLTRTFECSTRLKRERCLKPREDISGGGGGPVCCWV